jgi:hypothetical protein
MASDNPSTVFRVTGFQAKSDVQSTLAEKIHDLLTEDERERVQVSIACVPSCDESQISSALVEFKGGNPKFLSPLDHNPLIDWHLEIGDKDIKFDRHFFGFTQLYPTGQKVTAEYDIR